MQILARTFAVLALVALTTTAAEAQDAPARLVTGKWTGTVTPPGDAQVNISIEVTSKNDAIAMKLDLGGHGIYKAEGIRLETNRLVFSFTPGPTVVCILNKKDDGSFAGECADDGGDAAQMVIMPPKKEG